MSVVPEGSINPMETQGYSAGIFECFKDIPTCLCVCCLSPSLVIGLTQGAIKGNGFDFLSCCCGGIAAYRLRRYVQNKFGIQESEDASMIAIGCCGSCAVCQDVSELSKRGELSLGGQPKGREPMTVKS
ncbi:uncharacterized protein BJ171DRAFT_628961 [Polychytrium aggregatum]|uniref:uncharacterized protein n=1 Tax=Polychytrium aggregatum TaxID=110093 RepID=UPI0022FDF721|nr:uncharacterized protein BJ171DRAFT_628961 [Polychytrium aggregatum]KAI9202074.1 hypothetical protein BJ171DRAFT_628961 [Polychytrium aggregatum]